MLSGERRLKELHSFNRRFVLRTKSPDFERSMVIKMKHGQPIFSIMDYMKENRLFILVFSLLLIIGPIISGILSIYMVSQMIDMLVIGDLSRLALFAGLWLVFSLFALGINTLIPAFSLSARKKATIDLENKLLFHYMNLQFWDKGQADKTVFLIKNNAARNMESIMAYYTGILSSGSLLFFGSLYALLINPIITLASYVAGGMILVATLKHKGEIAHREAKQQDTQNQLSAFEWEQINNFEIARFLSSKKLLRPYISLTADFIKDMIRYRKLTRGLQIISGIGSYIVLVLVVIIFVILFYAGAKAELSHLYVMAAIMPQLIRTLTDIPALIVQKEKISGAFKEMEALLLRPLAEENKTPPEAIAQMVIENLSFCYQEENQKENQEKPVLDNISFRANRGDIIALAGISGSGKTTLIRILLKLLPYSAGKIRINKVELNDIARQAYWDKIGYIGQNAELFADTLLYNVSLNDKGNDKGNDKKNDESSCPEKVKMALRRAGMEDKIGTDAAGVKNLSSGEKQKIAFARIFYHMDKYDVFILDEAMSALDQDSYISLVKDLMTEVKKAGKIMLITSHAKEIRELADHAILL
jgi:ABC-type multidrug transport system fused ATPase/permease subunit